MKKYLSIFLVFFLLFSFAVPAFAAEDYPLPSLDGTSCDSYYIWHEDESNHCYLFDSSSWDIYYSSSNIKLLSKVPNPTTVYHSFKRTDDLYSSGWGTFSPVSLNDYTLPDGSIAKYFTCFGNVTSSNVASLVITNVDIYQATFNTETGKLEFGDPFFLQIPPLVVETQKALIQFQTQTSQTIMIIVLCGVGCLAFLISLPILRKVLLRFLNR